MKKIACIMVVVGCCNVYGMDQSEFSNAIVTQKRLSTKPIPFPSYIPNDWRKVRSEVAQRHDVPVFHKNLHEAAIYNRTEEVQKLLQSAGTDATELVSTIYTGYGFGTLLDLTFIENKPEVRKIVMPYLDNDVLKQCFERNRKYLKEMWDGESYKKGLRTNLPVENVVRYLQERYPVLELMYKRQDIELMSHADIEFLQCYFQQAKAGLHAMWDKDGAKSLKENMNEQAVRFLYRKNVHLFPLTPDEVEKLIFQE